MRENVGEFTIVYISYFSESGIWLGKILANGVPFAKSASFPPPMFCAIRYIIVLNFCANYLVCVCCMYR